MESASPICPACAAAAAGPRCAACGCALLAGGFRVERVLSQTAHSRVYAAQGSAGERVALKELVFAMVPGAQEIDAFHREARLLRELSHPRIPRFVSSFQEGEGASLRLYLAQELIEGTTLAQRMAEHRFTAAEAVRIGRQVLEVLRDLHELPAPLIHRDVKPQNLIERSSGALSLVDFGAAREIAASGTHRATLVGTFGFMAPEQLGGSADQTADLYGLGATLVNLLSRKPPEDLLWSEPPAELSAALHVGAPLARWLEKLVARRRDGRFPTAREALAALDKLEAAGEWALLPMPSSNVAAKPISPVNLGSPLPRGEAELMLLPGTHSRSPISNSLDDLRANSRRARVIWFLLIAGGAAAAFLSI